MMPASRTNRARTLSSASPLRSISALIRRHCRSVSTKLGWMQLTCTPSSLPRWARALLKAAQAALTELPLVKAASGLRPLVPPLVMAAPRLEQRPGRARQPHMGEELQRKALLPVGVGEFEKLAAFGGARVLDEHV